MEVGEPFNHDGEEVNPKSQFENTIGAYLMKDSDSGDMIRAGSTTTYFGKRLREHGNAASIEMKRERMIVYLFELLLSISLEPSKNISSNPGFEMFNGSFAKARDS